MWAYDPLAIDAVCPKNTEYWQHPFLGRWTGSDLGLPGPSSMQSIHLGLAETSGSSGTLVGYGWSSLGRTTIFGRFDDLLASGRTRLKLDFDFGQDLAQTGKLAECILPRSSLLEGFKMSFRGEYEHGDDEHITGTWVMWASDWKPEKEPQVVFRRVPDWMFAYRSIYAELLATSSASGRWKAAIQTVLRYVRRRGISWAHLKARRDDRRMILTYFYRLANSVPLSEDELAALRNRMVILSPEDGWSYLQRLKWAHLWTRVHAYTCNHCEQEIVGGRLYCVDCQIPDNVRSNSFDLCDKHECITGSIGMWANGGVVQGPHESSHRLVLFRHTVTRMYYANTIDSAQGWAINFVKRVMPTIQRQNSGEPAEPASTTSAASYTCSVCRGPLYDPFWLCLSLNCDASRVFTCDACVHGAPCTNPRRDVQYKVSHDSDILAASEVTVDTVHPADHHLLRCASDMKLDGPPERPESPESDNIVVSQHLDSLREQHSQLAKEHNDLMGKHTELMSKHTQLMDAYERLSHHILGSDAKAPITESKAGAEHSASVEAPGGVNGADIGSDSDPAEAEPASSSSV
ncbi:unnamed protein product [Peniophora sp. CBMAI 1063]|nr:unnamed protein product [Peniophora sp. CBMAI 1063]